MSKGTTRRTVRIEDGLWDEAQAAASERGDNLSEVLREALRQYVGESLKNSVEPPPQQC